MAAQDASWGSWWAIHSRTTLDLWGRWVFESRMMVHNNTIAGKKREKAPEWSIYLSVYIQSSKSVIKINSCLSPWTCRNQWLNIIIKKKKTQITARRKILHRKVTFCRVAFLQSPPSWHQDCGSHSFMFYRGEMVNAELSWELWCFTWNTQESSNIGTFLSWKKNRRHFLCWREEKYCTIVIQKNRVLHFQPYDRKC